jgi:hypothetical protein
VTSIGALPIMAKVALGQDSGRLFCGTATSAIVLIVLSFSGWQV